MRLISGAYPLKPNCEAYLIPVISSGEASNAHIQSRQVHASYDSRNRSSLKLGRRGFDWIAMRTKFSRINADAVQTREETVSTRWRTRLSLFLSLSRRPSPSQCGIPRWLSAGDIRISIRQTRSRVIIGSTVTGRQPRNSATPRTLCESRVITRGLIPGVFLREIS